MGFCTNCGAKLETVSKFCTRCGAEVTGADIESVKTDNIDFGVYNTSDNDTGGFNSSTYDTGNYGVNDYDTGGFTPLQQPYQQPYQQQSTRSAGNWKKAIAWIVVIASALFLGVVLFFIISGDGGFPGRIFSRNPSNDDGGSGISAAPPSSDIALPEQTDPPNEEPDEEGIWYVVVPDLVGQQQATLENIFHSLGLIPEFIFIDNELEAGTVISVASIGMQVPENSTLQVHISLGPPYIFIENPKIVVTARYDTGRSRFVDRDAYADAVRAAGGIPVQPGEDSILAAMFRDGRTDNVDTIAENYDGLVLTGGGDISARFFGQDRHPASGDPDENCDTVELALCLAFIRAGKPVLGINRGMQIINVALGGDIIQDIPDLLGIASDVHLGNNRHSIDIESGTWLYEMYGRTLSVTSNHHQAVGRIADGVTVAARVGLVVEALEYGNVLGVQFNPERLSDRGRLIYTDFINRCSYFYIR